MEDVEKLVKATFGEINRVFSTNTVFGEPIKVEERTLIPVISVGFGFGAGGGTGGKKGEGEGVGGGTGGGAGVSPVAVIVIDKEDVKVIPLKEKGGISAGIEKFMESMPKMMEKCMEMRGKKEEK